MAAIDRRSIVLKHSPALTDWDAYAPLSIGNGEFCYTCDLTGLQSYDAFYEPGIPLLTQAQWGWHTRPYSEPEPRFDYHRMARTLYSNGERDVPYTTRPGYQPDEYSWLRQNPHKFHMGRLSWAFPSGKLPDRSEIQSPWQKLSLWEGLITSRFRVQDQDVEVRSWVHPSLDMVNFLIRTPLFTEGLKLALEFPAPSPRRTGADWTQPSEHQSRITRHTEGRVEILRIMDDDRYFVTILAGKGVTVAKTGSHRFEIASASETMELSLLFTERPAPEALPSFPDTLGDTVHHWESFWQKGGFISIGAGGDEGRELQRRIILSQYLTAITCAGSLPPQETGLTMNSWYGKFHLEMHYWHAAHFASWGRPELLEKSLWYYQSILPKALELAAGQGYLGARWPKMTDYTGVDSPSPIGPLLIWQQPHPIYYAELLYRAHPTLETLKCYRDIVLSTAEFMADYARWDADRQCYVLGPGMIPSQENHNPRIVINPPYELEYWAWGLTTANTWLKRLGEEENEEWLRVAAYMAPPPVKDNLYLAHERCPDTYTTLFNRDHPSMVAAMGMLPGKKINPAIMEQTLRAVLGGSWQMNETWGWDYPMLAMCAARLGLPHLAVQCLLFDSPKNVYLPNGHNRQADRADIPCYLPGNGGLLLAVGLMAAGWDGCSEKIPGFPLDWEVTYEDILPLP